MYPELLKIITTRTIRERLQRHLNLPSCKVAIKPMFTEEMNAEAFFCKPVQILVGCVPLITVPSGAVISNRPESSSRFDHRGSNIQLCDGLGHFQRQKRDR